MIFSGLRSATRSPSRIRASLNSKCAAGFNDHCDAVTATAVSERRRAAAAESAVLEFLNGDVIMQWVKVTLGL